MAESESQDQGRGLRFVVYGETTILDADGTPIGRLRPGNTYVGIEVTDDYLVIKSPTKGRAYVELDMVSLMDEPAPAPGIAPVTSPAAGPAPTAPTRPHAHAPAAGGQASSGHASWRHPAVLVGLVVAFVAAVVVALVLSSGGGENDPIATELGGRSDASAGAGTSDEPAGIEQADSAGAAGAAGDIDPVDPADSSEDVTEGSDSSEDAGAATGGSDSTEDAAAASEGSDSPEDAGVATGGSESSDPSQDSDAVGPGGPDPAGGPPVIVGSGIATADGTLENRSFTQTAFGDLTKTASFPSPGPVEPPVQRWRVDDPLASDPVLVRGAVVAGFDDGTIRALEATTGSEIWRTELDVFRANALWVAGDTILATEGPDIGLYDLATGEPVGVFARPEGIEGFAHDSLLVAGVFVAIWTDSEPGDVRATVAAFDAASGASLWQVSTRGPAFPAPLTFTTGALIYGHEGSVRALELLTGRTRWAYEVDQFLPLSISTQRDQVVFRDTALRSIDARSGDLLWSGSQSSATIFAIDRGRIVAAETDLGVIELPTGARRSAGRVPEGLFGRGISAAAQGVGYAQVSDGSIVAVDLDAARPLWTARVTDGEFAPSTPMLVGEGLVFLVESDRQLIAAG